MYLQEEDNQKFSSHLQFGQCGNSKPIYFLKVKDLDKKFIMIPYKNKHQTVQQLINSYMTINTFANKKLDNLNLVNSKTKFIYRKFTLLQFILQSDDYQFIQLISKKIEQTDFTFLDIIQKQQISLSIRFSYSDAYNLTMRLSQTFQDLLNYLISNAYMGHQTFQSLQSRNLLISTQSRTYRINQILDKKLIQMEGIRKFYQCFGKDKSRRLILDIFYRFTGGCFHPKTYVYKKFSKQKTFIRQLKIYDKVLSLNLKTHNLQEDQIINVHSNFIFAKTLIQLSNGIIIQTTPNHKFLCLNKQWKNHQINDQNTQILKVGLQLLYIDQNFKNQEKISIVKIQTVYLDEPEQYFHICLKNNGNFIVNGLVAHNMQIIIKTTQGKNISINASPTNKIKDIKQNIFKLLKIPIQQQTLFYSGKLLQDQKSLSDYLIGKEQKILLIFQNIQIANKLKISKIDKKTQIWLKLNQTQKILVFYQNIRYKTVLEVVQSHIDSSQTHCKFYCFLYGNRILQPQNFIIQIQKQKYFNTNNLTLILVKNAIKLIFKKFIHNQMVFKDKTQFQNQLLKRQTKYISERTKKSNISLQFKKQLFFLPVQIYTTKFYKEINEFLNNLWDKKINQIFQTFEFKIIASLILNLKNLPNYVGQVHRGAKRLRFSALKKQGELFYWKAFTSTSLSQKVAKNFAQINSTLFHINSLTGKYIKQFSVYQTQQQILFAPYTYFLVRKILKRTQYDEVWLDQVPTPYQFDKTLILWVDDNPKNNQSIISKKKNNQILTLTSTKMAQQWLKQFGWLLNWMEIKIKIISDMTRYEQDKKVPNYYAGIDLLQLVYNKYGWTTPLLIYCNNVNRAKQNVQKRKIIKDRIYQITCSSVQVQKYIG